MTYVEDESKDERYLSLSQCTVVVALVGSAHQLGKFARRKRLISNPP